MLTLRVVVANGVPRGEAEDSSRRALDSGTADLGGVLPDNLGEVTVEVDVHVGRGGSPGRRKPSWTSHCRTTGW